MIFSAALGEALSRRLKEDSRVVLLGEDIADPYGGAFKVTKGLLSAYPGRVLTTPVSEAAMAGISAGLALQGYRPILEVMFGDFLALCFDQVLNHISKFEAMSGGKAACPVIIRTPMGGGRGYGPTHSQSLEKHFFGISGLEVVAASLFHSPEETFCELLSKKNPVLYIEHKLLYPAEMMIPQKGHVAGFLTRKNEGESNVCSISAVPPEQCQVTVLAYGYQAAKLLPVMKRLAVQDEIFVELLVPSRIAPVDFAPIERSLEKTGTLVIVEEGGAGWSWGSEIASTVQNRFFGRLKVPVTCVTSESGIVPSARDLEERMLVNEKKVEDAVRRCL